MMSEKGTVIKMKEHTVEPNGICTKRSVHLKVLLVCLMCSLIYIYLYSNLTLRTIAVNDMMKDTINDLQRWKNKVEGWVRGFSDKSQHQSTESTHAVRSTSMTSNPTTPSPISKHFVHSTKPNLSTESRTLQELILSLKEAINRNEADPLLTLFTTWPTKKEKFGVHNSTIRNWKSLSPFIRPVLFTNEHDLGTEVKKAGWSVLPVTKSAIGIPVLKYMYLDAMAKFKSTFYAYSNGDILYTESLIETLLSTLNFNIDLKKPLLLVGQRTNVQDVTDVEASSFDNIRKVAHRGKLFTTYAEDYFITTANYPWKDCAEVVIGRRAYDNWLVLNARKHDYITIDGTKTLLAVHQTTKAGNYEGHAVPHSNYNDKLLVNVYRRVHYGSGLTSCTSYYTVPSQTGPKLAKRQIHKSCFPL